MRASTRSSTRSEARSEAVVATRSRPASRARSAPRPVSVVVTVGATLSTAGAVATGAATSGAGVDGVGGVAGVGPAGVGGVGSVVPGAGADRGGRAGGAGGAGSPTRGAANTIAGTQLPLPSPAFVVEPGGVVGVKAAPTASGDVEAAAARSSARRSRSARRRSREAARAGPSRCSVGNLASTRRGGAGDLGRRHRGAAHPGVAVAPVRAVDAHAGRGDVDAGPAVVREAREVVAVVGRRDAEDVRQVVRARDTTAVVSSFAVVVAGGGDEEDVRGGLDRVVLRLREARRRRTRR